MADNDFEFINFSPLFSETEATIRARVDADVNAGLSSDDPDFVDTREGQFFQIVTQPVVTELARAYDEMSTRLAAGFVAFAWGTYLDYHGVLLNKPRKAAVVASGIVTFTGANGSVIPIGTVVSPTQLDPNISVPLFETTEVGIVASGTADVAVIAQIAGADGNVAAEAIDVIVSSPPTGITGLDGNADPTTGGTDLESDADYRTRLLESFASGGGANIARYKQWALSYEGVGGVTVQPAWDGGGTVRLVIVASPGVPASSPTITGLQHWLDPDPGLGHGEAPVGAEVTVTTPTFELVDVTAAVVFEDGFSLDGSGGTVALEDAIAAQIRNYIDNLDVGEDVIKNHIEAQFFRVKGVHNVTVTLPAADVSIDGGATPPEVAKSDTILLT